MFIQDKKLNNLVKYKIFWGTRQIESFERDISFPYPYKKGDIIERFRQKFYINKVIYLRINNILHVHFFTKTEIGFNR